jgi:hypothetical protein
MSLSPATQKSVLDILRALEPAASAMAVKVLQNIERSPDPLRTAKRAALASASEQATEAALKKILGSKK